MTCRFILPVCMCFASSFTSSAQLFAAPELISTAALPAVMPLDGPSLTIASSADGRWLVTLVDAQNLVPGDTNGYTDVVLVDRHAGTRVIVSQAGATPADGSAGWAGPDVSDDGRYVVFISDATNLVPGDDNGRRDLFRKDMHSGIIQRLTGFDVVANSWPYGLLLSGDGNFVAFMDVAANWVPGGSTERVILRANWASSTVNAIGTDFPPSMNGNFTMSRDARCMVYYALAGGTRGRLHVFLTGAEMWVDQPAAGGEPNGKLTHAVIDATCSQVGFLSSSDNLLPGVGANHVYRRQLDSGLLEWVTQLVQPEPFDYGSYLSMSPNGRYFVVERLKFRPYDSAETLWIEFRDMAEPNSQRATWLDGHGVALSNLGAALARTDVARSGDLNGYVDIHISEAPGQPLHPLLNAASTIPLAAANGANRAAGLRSRSESRDGRFVFFESLASNLLEVGDTDTLREIFVRDRDQPRTDPAFVTPVRPNGDSFLADVSADARYLLFWSCASNLVPDDQNGRCDLFLADRVAGTIERSNVGTGGAEANYESNVLPRPAQVSDDGRFVVFESRASNLVQVAHYPVQVYVRDRETANTWSAFDVNQALTLPTRLLDLAESTGYLVIRNQNTNASPGCSVVGVDLRTRARDCPWLDSQGQPLPLSDATLSADGRFLAARDNNNPAIHIRDRQLHITRLATLDVPDELTLFNPALSGNGRYLSLTSYGDWLVTHNQVFDLLLNAWVTAPGAGPPADSHVLAYDGSYEILATPTVLMSADLNGQVADVYRSELRGDGLFGGGWQGGFE